MLVIIDDSKVHGEGKHLFLVCGRVMGHHGGVPHMVRADSVAAAHETFKKVIVADYYEDYLNQVKCMYGRTAEITYCLQVSPAVLSGKSLSE